MDGLLVAHETIPHALEPLENSHEADAVEAAFKRAFMEVFEELLREKFDRVNLYGIPHRGDQETVERFTKQDGIAIYRANSELFLRELFRGWKSQHTKRGLEFLRFYLQLIFPNQWGCVQLWHSNTGTYPNVTYPAEVEGTSFLTSRVVVNINSPSINEAILLQKIVPALRSVVAAKFVLLVRSLHSFSDQTVVGTVAVPGQSAVFFGTAS